VAADQAYKQTHENLIAFIQHVIIYVDTHGNDLQLWGFPVNKAFFNTVLSVGAAQALTLMVSIVNSLTATSET
jgi:hypothetical protein